MLVAMDMLIAVIVFIGKVLIGAIGVIVVLAVMWFAWAAYVRATTRHEPIEYYGGWGGYWHPIGLSGKISKEEADARQADGRVYLIGYYDGRRLMRVTKMLNGAMFFDFEYTYYPNGKCKTVKTTNAKGVVKFREYDRRGRPRADNPKGFW
jgi:hypothetical protein